MDTSKHPQSFIAACLVHTSRRLNIGISFDTFSWPQFEESREANEGGEGKRKTSPTSHPSRDTLAKIDAVAAAREVRRVRAEALRNLNGDLRALYRTLEWTRSRPLARPFRAFCFAKFLSPFPKRLKCPARIR
jgi:hypothetical protein